MNVCRHFNPILTLVLKNKDIFFALKIDICLQRLGTSCDPRSNSASLGGGGVWKGRRDIGAWSSTTVGGAQSLCISAQRQAVACLDIYQELSGAFTP